MNSPIHPHLVVMKELLQLLQSYDIEKNQKQTRDKSQKTLKLRFQFIIGLTYHQRTFGVNSSFRFKHDFIPNLGVYSTNENQLADPLSAKIKKGSQKDIYRKARELLHIIDPEYAANDHWVIQVHCLDNTSIIGRHVDAKDIIFQYGVTVSEFEGGNLLTWNSSGVVTKMNVCNKTVKLDGRLHHDVTPIIRGIRFSLYYFKTRFFDQ